MQEELKCSYCRLVLKDPVQTSEIGRRYYKEGFTEAATYVSVTLSLC